MASFCVIFVLVASYTFLAYWSYSADFYKHPDTYVQLVHGTGPAPAQYRVALVFAAQLVNRVTHLGFRHMFTFFDLIFAGAASLLLWGVLVKSSPFRTASAASQWTRITVMLGLFSYYFSWSLWYQRPETMACAFFVAASLYLISLARSQLLLASGLVVLSVWQGFVRADVAILFHFGLFVYLVVRGPKGFPASRTTLLAISLVCCAIPTVILWLLTHKIFPHASYGDTKVVQLITNLSLEQLVPFFLFSAPVLYTYRQALIRFSRLQGPQIALILSSVFYLCSWFLLGRAWEVRIFVPFAMALVPLSANLVAEEVA
jgi:hypothetical protein